MRRLGPGSQHKTDKRCCPRTVTGHSIAEARQRWVARERVAQSIVHHCRTIHRCRVTDWRDPVPTIAAIVGPMSWRECYGEEAWHLFRDPRRVIKQCAPRVIFDTGGGNQNLPGFRPGCFVHTTCCAIQTAPVGRWRRWPARAMPPPCVSYSVQPFLRSSVVTEKISSNVPCAGHLDLCRGFDGQRVRRCLSWAGTRGSPVLPF